MSDDLDRELEARFDRELADVRVPATWSFAKRPKSPLGLAVSVVVVAALLVGATMGGLALRAARDSQSAAVPSPSPSPERPSSTPIASPMGGLVSHENAILGYRIALPEGYRRSISRIQTGQESLGVDLYTRVTEREEREACLRDVGDVGSPLAPGQDPDIRIGVARNVRGVSAVEWATTPRSPGAQPLSTHQRVEPVIVGGREAVRLVADNATAVTTAFVIRANDRMYELYPSQGPPSRQTWLDDIAKSFVVIEPAPFPTPTATTPPRVAARQLGEALAKAFAARDADAVARLMPACQIGVGHYIDSTLSGGALNRSVALFTQALRDRFASGDLTVTVETALQTKAEAGGEQLFVRSAWREPDRTTQIDLFLTDLDGRWRWFIALHHYSRADLLPGTCIPYRSPWVSPGGRC